LYKEVEGNSENGQRVKIVKELKLSKCKKYQKYTIR